MNDEPLATVVREVLGWSGVSKEPGSTVYGPGTSTATVYPIRRAEH